MGRANEFPISVLRTSGLPLLGGHARARAAACVAGAATASAWGRGRWRSCDGGASVLSWTASGCVQEVGRGTPRTGFIPCTVWTLNKPSLSTGTQAERDPDSRRLSPVGRPVRSHSVRHHLLQTPLLRRPVQVLSCPHDAPRCLLDRPHRSPRPCARRPCGAAALWSLSRVSRRSRKQVWTSVPPSQSPPVLAPSIQTRSARCSWSRLSKGAGGLEAGTPGRPNVTIYLLRNLQVSPATMASGSSRSNPTPPSRGSRKTWT